MKNAYLFIKTFFLYCFNLKNQLNHISYSQTKLTYFEVEIPYFCLEFKEC